MLLWNVYLTGEITKGREREEEFKLKIDMLEGDLKIMEYDLVTTRDSIRILNAHIDGLDSLKKSDN